MNKFIQNKILFGKKMAPLLVAASLFLFSSPIIASANYFPNATAEMQTVLGKKITIAIKDMKLNEALLQIQKQGGIGFAFEKGIDVNNLPSVSIAVKNMAITEVLGHIFTNIDYVYRVVGDEIIIAHKPRVVIKKGEVVRLMGKIVDDSSTPLVGAVLVVEGTSRGAIAEEGGNFAITANIGDVIEASFVGHRPMKYSVTKADNKIILKLNRDQMVVDDVIVTGYQKIDKRYNTSAIQSLKASEIVTAGITSLDKALEGRVPEMLFTSNSGEVGSTPRLRIRGTSTLLGNREPLWVLDGFVLQDPVNVSNDDLNNPDYVNIIGNAIAGINPQDIERIDILKDASATALYGTRAANGVIVVTTKKGTISKPQISYNHSSKIIQSPSYTDRNIVLMDSKERVQFGKDLTDLHYSFPNNMPLVGYEGAYYRYQTGVTTFNEFQDEVRRYESVNTDWFGLLTQTNYSHDHTLSIAGGTEDVRYYASVGYNRENSVTKNVFTDRFTGRVNLTGTILKKITFNLGMSGNAQKKNHLADDLNAIDYAYSTTRALPSHNEDGSPFMYDAIKYNLGNVKQIPYAYNILNEMENSANNYKGSAVNMNIDLKYKPIDDLTISVAGSYNRSSTLQEKWWGEKSHRVTRLRNSEYGTTPPINDAGNSIVPYGGTQSTTNTIGESFTFRSQIDYLKFFGANTQHRIDVSGGFEAYSTESYGVNNLVYGYFRDRGMKYLSNVELEKYPHYQTWLNSSEGRSMSNNVTRTVSGYMTLTYSYKDYFSTNVNGRFDISNKFGSRSNERFLPIWSISGMANLKNIMLPESKVLSGLTIRSSFGLQGNMLEDQSPDFIIRMDATNPDYNENTSRVERLPNPNLRWEKTRQFNIGLDASLFEGRFSVNGSYYTKNTDECFSAVTVPTVNGVNSFIMNNGSLSNVGYSVSVRVEPIRTKDFTWYIGGSFSGNKNSVKTQNKDAYTFNSYLAGNALVANEAITTFYSYNFLGLNPLIGIPTFNDYEDSQHLLEGKSLEETIMMTMVRSGVREPKFQGSFNTGFNFKGFTFSMMFSAGFGSKVRLFSLYSPILAGVSAENNIRKEFTNRWQVPGDESKTSVPVILSPSDPNYTKYLKHYSQISAVTSEDTKRSINPFANNIWSMYDNSQQRVVSGNYLKISSIAINYRLNPDLLKNLPLTGVTFGFDVRDVFTFSAKELRGQDPMQSGFDKPNLSTRPAYTFNIRLSF